MDEFIECDHRGCNARAYNEVLMDSELALWACDHHAAEWLNNIPEEERFRLDHSVLYGLRTNQHMDGLDLELMLR